ncbi:GDSL-type esterase/lipase family protein [Spongiimicrobium salis]|uniref:GDSL-type esterase/lipase family protein n=1 Tax=Spongiimicrobium salis TaxID=1667022 RepID=UPI00374D298A
MKYAVFLFLFFTTCIYAQGFKDEVLAIQKKYDTILDRSKETIVFTGSSSVRLWRSLESDFPNHQIVNSGFGGSQAYDLLQYTQELILQYHPKKVFIYEGDNDVFSRKKTKEIIATTQEIIKKIKAQDQNTEIVLISAKPSLARWKLRRRYRRLNRAFKALSETDEHITFANVWNVMLKGKGRRVRKDIFVSDGLHMNPKGYALWYDVIRQFMD